MVKIMNKTLINASAAREGGALAIVEEYVKHHDNDGVQYILLSPIKPKQLPSNFLWKYVETKGISTILFAIFFVVFYVKKYNATKIISFSNVNLFFTCIEKVTYFHNFLILNDASTRFVLIKECLKVFGKVRQRYIFQTRFVYSEFCKEIFVPSLYNIAWPGVKSIVDGVDEKNNELLRVNGKIQVLVPIVDLNNKNKNIDLLYSVISRYGFSEIEFNVTAPPPNNSLGSFSNVKFLGKLSKEEYIEQLLLSNAVLVLSFYETVCLPIFEALSVGKLALVYERDYVKSFFDDFGEIKGLMTFIDIDDFKDKLESLEGLKNNHYKINPEILIGNWEF
ncbi:glycosyltransferase family 1 protein [Vibrio vulnificus]|nr:glycosyltransferase family 1 protein [Vibrio vulnificus]